MVSPKLRQDDDTFTRTTTYCKLGELGANGRLFGDWYSIVVPSLNDVTTRYVSIHLGHGQLTALECRRDDRVGAADVCPLVALFTDVGLVSWVELQLNHVELRSASKILTHPHIPTLPPLIPRRLLPLSIAASTSQLCDPLAREITEVLERRPIKDVPSPHPHPTSSLCAKHQPTEHQTQSRTYTRYPNVVPTSRGTHGQDGPPDL